VTRSSGVLALPQTTLCMLLKYNSANYLSAVRFVYDIPIETW